MLHVGPFIVTDVCHHRVQTLDLWRWPFAAPIAARVDKPVADLKRGIWRWSDASCSDFVCVQLGLIAPTAELSKAQFPAGEPLRPSDDRTEC
ncbi:unannotated protein [freshwater metagenome]|uniref:Unannotated protein n=1 Tax=freshwater metagenome TaxID=449393 RepID=A0A6J6GLI4_9ZZZZ